MSPEETAVPQDSEQAIPVFTVPDGTPDKLETVRAAAKVMAEHRADLRKKAAESAGPPAAEPKPVQAEEADAAPPEEATGETQEVDPEKPETAPPIIEPPKSWSREARERWSNLDPDTQQYLLERDRQDSTAVRKAQNEAAEKAKAVEVERQAVVQARQQYESALPVLMQRLQSGIQGEFADIRTMDDVTRLAKDDWPRYIQWDAQQKQLEAVQKELAMAQQRQQNEQSRSWQSFAAKEDELFAEAVPEMKDEVKGPALKTKALKVLRDLGFTDDELRGSYETGEAKLSLRDHRLQRLILDATKFRTAQTAKPAAKPVPPVQRPGTAGTRESRGEQNVRSLQQVFEQTGNPKDAARFIAQRRAEARR